MDTSTNLKQFLRIRHGFAKRFADTTIFSANGKQRLIFDIFCDTLMKVETEQRSFNVKKLGLIGGTGPESTAIYYRSINSAVSAKTGGDYPEMTIESLSLKRALGYCSRCNYDGLTVYLLSAIEKLANSGADFAALTANTMHIVYDRLTQLSPLPLVSIVDASAERAAQQGYKKIGLLGTIFTMESDFFKRPFEARGIEVIVPPKDNRKEVNRLIADEIEKGIVRAETTAQLTAAIDGMKRSCAIEALALGCTELPLALNESNCPVPCIDTMAIHIEKLVSMITE